jgi:hypothetical protein
MYQKASKRQVLKNVTLRFDKETYELLVKAAKADNRSLANFIETHTLRVLKNSMFTSAAETSEITCDQELMNDLKRAESDIKHKRGRYV